MKKHLGMIVAATLVAGCAGFTGQRYVDDLNAVDLSGNGFTTALAREYRDLANFEWSRMLDYRDGQHYAKKGLSAAAGEAVAPDALGSRHLPEFALADIASGHDRLVTALAAGAGERHPDVAARAQAKFDCWMEQQEENHQPQHIASCRKEFEDAMLQIAASKYMVFFDFGSSRLTRAGRQILSQAVANAKANGTRQFEIVGHTDTVGSDRANRALSRARAQAVKAYLVSQGIFGRHISVTGAGESAQLVATADGVKQPENRRAEVINFR